MNYKYIPVLAGDGKKFTKKKKNVRTSNAIKMKASFVNRGLSP